MGRSRPKTSHSYEDVGVRHAQAVHHAGGGGGNSEGHVGVGKREVRGGDERCVGGGVRRAQLGAQAGVETPAMAEALRAPTNMLLR